MEQHYLNYLELIKVPQNISNTPKRLKAWKDLNKFIDTLDVDKEFKESIVIIYYEKTNGRIK